MNTFFILFKLLSLSKRLRFILRFEYTISHVQINKYKTRFSVIIKEEYFFLLVSWAYPDNGKGPGNGAAFNLSLFLNLVEYTLTLNN